eukprot:11166649-Lingulodinium_polyedra.AAC.1
MMWRHRGGCRQGRPEQLPTPRAPSGTSPDGGRDGSVGRQPSDHVPRSLRAGIAAREMAAATDSATQCAA